jgi:hypothetical protein
MTRLELRTALQEELASCDNVLAMWESGSHAFARADEYSDLDVGLLVREGTLDQAWAAVDRALEGVGGFHLRWQLPGHLFKGMTQRVYHPRRGGRWLALDIGIFEESAEDLYLDAPRHGRAEVLFDRSGRVTPPPWDPAKHRQTMREALHQDLMRWRSHATFFRKELARGRNVDAFGFYVGLALRPLLSVLGMLHRPDRFDYGFRYVKEDMPPDVVARIERLCYVPSAALLEERFAEAEAMFDETVEELGRRGITPVDKIGVDVRGGT